MAPPRAARPAALALDRGVLEDLLGYHLRRSQVYLAKPLPLANYRPEYHRAILEGDARADGGRGGLVAHSTGNQASSRLLSMRSANALLELPQGEGSLPAGAVVSALLIVDL